VVGPALAACDRSDAAAVIGPEVITQERFSELWEDINALVAPGASQADRVPVGDVMGQLVMDRVASQLLAGTDYDSRLDELDSRSSEEWAEVFAREWAAQGLESQEVLERIKKADPEAIALVEGARGGMLNDAVAAGDILEEQISEALAKVKLNPRYGEMNRDWQTDGVVASIERSWAIPEALLAPLPAEELFPEFAPESGQ
jgi:hypothetical protein